MLREHKICGLAVPLFFSFFLTKLLSIRRRRPVIERVSCLIEADAAREFPIVRGAREEPHEEPREPALASVPAVTREQWTQPCWP